MITASLLAGVIAPALPPAASPAAAAAGGQWFKTDTHVHSAFSGDALDDIGIIANAAKQRGYDAIFLTDHQGASSFPIQLIVANHVGFDDALGTKWLPHTYGTLTSSTNELVSSPVHDGTASMHLAASSASSGEAFTYLNRGPNLRSGPDVLDFWVYPKRIDAGSGAYVSVALGGDPSVQGPDGYTTNDGTAHPGRSTVVVWQLGSPRVDVSDPDARVVTHQLTYTLNQWNHYSFDVLPDINAALSTDSTRPLDYNGLMHIKLSTMARNGGTAEAYFDNVHLDANGAGNPGDEFVYRNSIIHTFDTDAFKIYPSVEMGVHRHAQRLDFDIPDAASYNSFFGCNSAGAACAVTEGIDGIAPTQQTGYSAQLNHPGEPGGVSSQEAISTSGEGADFMEVRDQTMIDIWDSILQTGYVLPGTWSSDMHRIATLDAPGRGTATYIYSPSVGFNDLMHSLFEGRMYLAGHTFAGRVIFNLDGASAEPYPARYPLNVPSSQASVNVHLNLTAGLATGQKVVWIRNGTVMATDVVSGSSYEVTRPVSLTGSSTYVRAEVQSSSGSRLAMTEPIFFKDDASLPTGITHQVNAVTTAGGANYTRLAVKGTTSSAWDSAGQSLSLTLDDGAAALTELTIAVSSFTPSSVKLAGSSVTPSATRSGFDAATGSAWYLDAGAHLLHVKAKPASSSATLLVQFAGSADTQKPTTPTNLQASATSGSQVHLSWNASTDNVAVTGYTIYRGGSQLATTPGSTLSFDDGSVAPATQYSYTVDAFDAAGNHSTPSGAVTVTTPAAGSVTTLTAVADAYVDGSNPAQNYGTLTSLRTDQSPDVRSYLRFDLSGISGTVTKATLRIWANSKQGSGWEARSSSASWTERDLNYANAPALGAVVGISGATTAGSWSSGDVSSLVSAGATVDLGITTPSTTALSLASRESGAATAPQLVVETSGGSPPPPADTQKPTTPTNLQASATSGSQVHLSWNASTDNVAVTGYTIYRGGSQLATTPGSTLSFDDGSVAPATQYSYTVDAFDAAGNHSTPSGAVTVTTPAAGSVTTTTFSAAADGYVDSSKPTTSYGGFSKLRVDGSPDVRSYLRFDLSGISGTVTKATLRIWANSSLSAGYEAHAVSDTTWTEAGLTYASAPTVGSGVVGTSGPVATGSWSEIDVTALVSGPGLRSLALLPLSSTNLSLASRESGPATAPQLVVETSGG